MTEKPASETASTAQTPYDSKESFAQDCLRVLEALEGYPYRISNLSINWRDEQPAQNGTVRVQSYELHINRPSIRNLSLDAISKQVMSEQYFVSADTGEAVSRPTYCTRSGRVQSRSAG